MDISPLREGLVKVTLSGRLDTVGVDRVERQFVSALVPPGSNAIVDLSQVDFVASVGIRMLIAAARGLRMKQATLALYGVQDRVGRVLESVSLAQIIPICSTEAEAFAAVTPRVP
jgi:stage II sporulation protein AA (anti-sigma F factor antagonist)